MNDKEKKAIERCYRRINELKLNFAITNEDLNAIETVLNLIENQKAELDNLKTIEENKFLRNQELGYIAGYEDGKKHKMTAVAMRIENMKYELYERHIKALKKRIEDLLSIEEAHRKENGKLRAEIEKKDKEIAKLKNNNKDLLRKLRNRVKEVKKLGKYSTYKKEFSILNKQLKKKDKIIDLMAEDKYENINMIQMANIGKEVNYDPTKLFSGIPDEEAIKIIKQYYEKKAEEDK